jgi:hypothetical protein
MKARKGSLSDLVSDIIPSAQEITSIKKQAKALGLFTHDRELLECNKCGFVEDVTSGGRLVTYHRNSQDMKDCALRFEELKGGVFRCPICKTRLKAVIL